MIVVNGLNSITVGQIFPGSINECCKAWFGSMAFVAAAGYIAPRWRVLTSIIVALLYSVGGTVAVVIAIRSGQNDHPAWLEILTTALCVAGAVVGIFSILGVVEDEKLKSV